MYFQFKKIPIFIFVLILLFSYSIVFGESLEWSSPDAYKPASVLFLHGFALGSPSSWSSVIDGKHDSKSSFDGIGKYFKKYAALTIDDDLSRPFLERVNFNDPNGSIDTYDSGKFNPNGNSQGWADKVKIKMDGILSKYRFKSTALKVNIICHSMGGLAAREYITNPKYSCDASKIDKLITIGTPHAGSPLGNIKKEIIGSMNKYIVEYPPLAKVTCKASLSINSNVVDLLLGDNKIEINGEALKDMSYGSNFLHVLNYQRSQPSNIKKYAICGWFNIPIWNLTIFHPFYFEKTNYDFNKLSDTVVPYDSQRGYDIITNYPQENWVWQPDNILEVNADHMHELENPDTVNYILKILDSTPPEFTLDTPQENSTTEINTTSISIKGKVYKEYLPADSEIVISGLRQEDGAAFNQINAPLKPSSLWIPNNPDSPVAEFDETIPFPGEGTYKISSQIKNPAGLTSDTKVFWVKVVLLQPNANIIVHCHNPEGKEIGSIQGVVRSVEIYDGATLIGYGAYNADTHGKPISIPSGNHTIKAKFNGMVLEQNINILGGTTQELTFTFTRTEIDVNSLISGSISDSRSLTKEYTCIWSPGSFNVWGYWIYQYHQESPNLRPYGFFSRTTAYGRVQYPQMNTIDRGEAPTFSVSVSNNINIYFNANRLTVSATYTATHPTTALAWKGSWINFGGDRILKPGVSSFFTLNPDFNSWFNQQIVTEIPPSPIAYVSLNYDDGSLYGVNIRITGDSLGYHCYSINTTIPWENLSINGFTYYDTEEGSPEGGTIERSYSIIGAGMKISSVPYDLLGTAV